MGEQIFDLLPFPIRQQIETDIIERLAKENCTVRDAQHILAQVHKYIQASAPVQFVGMPDYEF